MKLKANERCPIHKRRDCCGRSEVHRYTRIKHSKWQQVRPGVSRFWDENLGKWRYKLSAGEMRKLVSEKCEEQHNICPICDLPMEDFREVGPDHIEIRGMGGAGRDDSRNNVRAAHNVCNVARGSKPADWKWKRGERGEPNG